jgi:hypothetical protein
LILELPSISFLRKTAKSGLYSVNARVYPPRAAVWLLTAQKQAINIKLIDYIKVKEECQQGNLGKISERKFSVQ